MRNTRYWSLVLLVPMCLASSGCITAGAVLATKVIGDTVNDADVKKREDQIIGQPASAADKMFGQRHDTLVDVKKRNRKLLMYRAGSSHYFVAEVVDGKVITLDKKHVDDNLVGKLLKGSDMDDELIGRSPSECQRIADLGRPILTLHSEKNDDLVRVYNVKQKVELQAKYCVLRFNADDRCRSVTLVELSASTRKGGILRGK